MNGKSNRRTKLLFGGVTALLAGSAFARLPAELPEPSVLSLIGAAVVGAIVLYRLKRKK